MCFYLLTCCQASIALATKERVSKDIPNADGPQTNSDDWYGLEAAPGRPLLRTPGRRLLARSGAWTAVHAFHEEARHCQGRSEELSADGMFDRASIRTRWSSLRTRCSMKFDLAALLSLSRPLRTGRGLAVAANSVCPFALLRFLNLLQSDVLPSLLQSDVSTCLLRSDVPFCARGFRG